MNQNQEHNKDFTKNTKWLYAAALACLWAASEIVLGSFLHNLRVPMRGSILAAIGVMIMVSAGVRWKMSGVFWRAGLITALMKSVSPSAVLLGPMVAIFMQGTIMDLSSRIGRHRKISYIIGGGLSISWNFIQLILGYLLYYGYDVVELYDKLVSYAAKELGSQSFSGNSLLFILISVYFIIGVVAAFFGIRSLRKSKRIPHIKPQRDLQSVFSQKRTGDFQYSLYFALLIPLFVIAALYMLARMPVEVSFTMIPGLIIFLILRYRAGLRRLAKLKFWLVFLAITMLSSFLLGENLYEGMIIGVKMNFRAVFIIIALASFSMELKHPKINAFLSRSGSIIPSVLEATFDTLPMVISHLPEAKLFFKNPLKALSNLISNSFIWVDSLRFRSMKSAPILIITGEKGSGKSTLLEKVILILKDKNYVLCGFEMLYRKQNDIHVGYSLKLIPENKEIILAGNDVKDILVKVGPYSLSASAVKEAKTHVLQGFHQSDIVIIDELGPWEAMGGGWYSIMKKIRSEQKPAVLVVRTQLLESFLQFWSIDNYSVLDSDNANFEESTDSFIASL
ncbi:MAG: DUF2478 domain-containing protein [Bacteroidales bacterium]|nr:DUF2478 domain-containing protein [Bacteroidales bacterium]